MSCKLCLQNIMTDCLSEITKDDINMLTLCYPNTDTSALTGNICTKCKEKLMNYYEFKVKCLESEEKFPFLTKPIDKTSKICRTCMKTIPEEELSVRLKKGRMLKAIFEHCYPEINYLKSPLDPVICQTCRKYVKNSHDFLLMCTKNAKDSFLSKTGTKKSENKEDTDKRPMIRCTICPYETRKVFNFKRHMYVHTQPDLKLFGCTKCNYKGKTQEHVKKHMSIHGDGEDYNCAHCPYKSKRKQDLVKHLLTHDSEEARLFQCFQCDYKAKRRDHLKSHMAVHQKSKRKHKCKVAKI